MKLHLPNGLRAALLAALCVCSGSASAELTTVATMQQMLDGAGIVSATESTLWSLDNGLVYTFTGSNSFIGNISTDQLTSVMSDLNTNYVTVAAWVNVATQKVSGDGCSVFGYGGGGDGVKLIDNNGNLKFTTKSSADFTPSSSGSIALDTWTLVAVTFHQNGDNYEVHYFIDGAESSASAKKAKDPTAGWAIGSGNGDSEREQFMGEIGNFTVFTSTSWATAAEITAAMGDAPETYSPAELYWGRNQKDGNWNLEDTVWAGDTTTTGSFVFKNGKNAHFTLSGGGGTVTVVEAVVAGTVTVEDTYSFSATGQGSLKIAKLRVTEAGHATFNMALAGTETELEVLGSLSMKESTTAKSLSMGETGKLDVAADKTLTITDSATLRQESVLSGPGKYEIASVVLSVADPNEKEKQPKLNGGAVLETTSISGTGVLHMENSTLRAEEVGKVQVGSGATVEVDEGKSLTVKERMVFGKGATMDNKGILNVDLAGDVLTQSDIDLGEVDIQGALFLDSGAQAKVTKGYIRALNFESTCSLTAASDLTVYNTATNSGTLNVTGDLTVGGTVSVEKLTAGTLTMDKDAVKLTVSGQLTAQSITLGSLSTSASRVAAGSLGAGTTAFYVEESVLSGLGLAEGATITLAEVGQDFAEADSLTINEEEYITVDKLSYFISQDSATHNIILSVTGAVDGYIWTNENDTTKWSDGLNWLGKEVPDADARALVNAGADPWTINMDQDGIAKSLYFRSGSESTLVGDHKLEVLEEVRVYKNATLEVTEGVQLETGTLTVDGELRLAQAADGVGATVEKLSGSGLLCGPNRVVITGKGGVYKGSYSGADVLVSTGAEATLAAGEGLSLLGSGTATLTYSGKAAVIDSVTGNGLTLVLNGANVDNSGNTLTTTAPSSVTGGRIVSGLSAMVTAATLGSADVPVLVQADSLALAGTTVELVQTETNTYTMKLNTNGQREGLVLGYLGGEDTNADVVLTGNLFNKYYQNARLVGGVILVDLRDVNFSEGVYSYTYNGRAGAGMLDDVYKQRDPQNSAPDGDLAAVMNAIESGAVAKADHDRLAAAMAGASAAAMGYAYGKDVERQLHAIRNRTTGMGCAECVVNEDMPYVNAWVSAEGDFSRLAAENTYAGYSLNSWGGTVGCDMDFTNRFTAGLALTAMKGKFTSRSAEQGSGDLDRLYVSAFARYARRAWTHTFVGTIGTAEAKLDRTVSYAGGSYSTSGDTKGVAFGLMYEAGYTKALNESGSTCLQPLFSISYRHSTLDGYTERRSDAALHYSDIDMDVVTFSLGGRLQTVAGTSVYNRTSVLELRAMAKLDAGDRDATPSAGFLGVTGSRNIKSTETGSFGLALGAGLMVPVADDAGSLFFDVGAEFRSNYSDVNATVGYRVNF